MNVHIEQDNTRTEQVSSLIVDVLYRIAFLNNDFNISGRIKTTSAHQDAYDYLNNKLLFPNFYLETDNIYINFEDSKMEKVAAELYGDGVGVTVPQMKNATFSAKGTNVVNAMHEAGVINVDLRWCNFSNVRWNPWDSLKTMIGGKINVEINSDMPSDGIDKIVTNTLTLRIWADNEIINTIATRNFISDSQYPFRSITINKLYIGNTTPPVLGNGYGTTVNNCVLIFVPIGCAEEYKQASVWDVKTSGYEEYDFDNDPDGIFTEVDEIWTHDGTLKN